MRGRPGAIHWFWRGRGRSGTPPPPPPPPRKGHGKAPGGARPRPEKPAPLADCIYGQVGQILVAYDGIRVRYVCLLCSDRVAG